MILEEEKRSRKFRRLTVYAASTVLFVSLFIGLIYGLKPILLPITLGAFLAYLFKPVAKSFHGSLLTKYSRAAMLFLFVGSIIYWSIAFVKSSMPNEIEKLEYKVRLQYRMNDRYQNWMGLAENEKGNFIYKFIGADLDPLKQKVTEFLKLTPEERKQFLNDHKNHTNEENEANKYYNYYLANLKAQKVDIEKIQALAKNGPTTVTPDGEDISAATEDSNALANFLTAFSHWIIMPLTFMFLLFDKGQILHFMMSLIPNRYFELTHTIIENVDEALGKYIRGTMLECILVGITLIIGFFLCGMGFKMAFIIGAIGGLTNAIPFVGTFIACLIGTVYSLIAENIHPLLPFINENNLMIAVVCVVIIAHLLDNAVFQPLVVGSAVNIHPLAVVVGVFGGSMMFGVAGLIFAIPTIVIFKVVTETFFTGLKNYRII